MKASWIGKGGFQIIRHPSNDYRRVLVPMSNCRAAMFFSGGNKKGADMAPFSIH
jgi:hypothetical protein